jgi:hypothetical protein
MIPQDEETFVRSSVMDQRRLEHRFVQRVTMTCPEGHRIGTCIARTVPGSLEWQGQMHKGQDTPTGVRSDGVGVYVCQKCRTRHVGAAAFPSRAALWELVAAMHAYGLAHVTVPATTDDVLAKARAITPAGDPLSATRLEYLTHLRRGRNK